MKNEIIDEVRAARTALAAEHGYDRKRIYEWAKAAHAARQQVRAHNSPRDRTETNNGATISPAAHTLLTNAST